jgi:hypothetical protein
MNNDAPLRKIALEAIKIEMDDPSIKLLKGIVQPLELGGVTRLIRSAVKFCMAGYLKKKFLMVQSHERSLKLICAA